MAGAQFEHLAEQDQHDDDGGGFEIDGQVSVQAHGIREQRGCEHGDSAEEEGGADAEHDESPHVEVAGTQ